MTTSPEVDARFASPADVATYGEYTFNRDPSLPVYRFDGRVGPGPEAGRYHLYAGWFCPWAQRSTLVVELLGLSDAVGVSYVHGQRDARGWGFREPTGPDPVNGFTLLRDAYEATQPGFDGHVSVPTLWDQQTGRVLANTYGTIDVDLATRFTAHATTPLDLYPADLADDVDGIDAWLGPAVNSGVNAATTDPEARERFNRTLGKLDVKLTDQTYLLGDRLTLADLRLWVTLVRLDARANADGAIGPHLDAYPELWDWARTLYQLPAFTRTTDFSSFGARHVAAGPGTPAGPSAAAPGAALDWTAPTRRTA